MSIREAYKLALEGWRKGLSNGSTPLVSEPPAGVRAPTTEDIPSRWINTPFGPGAPIFPATTMRDRVGELEPRSFQYVPSVNATISPRLAYGLIAFSQLKYYAENIPEVSMCIRFLTETIKTLEPRIIGPKEIKVDLPELSWLTNNPDGFTPWSIWISRYLFNVLAYDAGALFYIYDEQGRIKGLRVIDGSTIFAIIDERGEQPEPPAPAFAQIIYGQPHVWLTTQQLYYQPRQVRSDAPYGRTFIEDSMRAVQYLDNLWSYESAGYTEGTMPEAFLEAPANWTPEQCVEWERSFNQRMAGSTAERRRVRVIPAGFNLVASKDRPWNEPGYKTALERLTYNAGIPMSELGQAPGTGLGGKGYQEQGASEFMRIGFGPLINYIESAFNVVLKHNGYIEYRFELDFSSDEIDVERRRSQATEAWINGAITRDEYRQAAGYEPIKGEAGAAFLMPAGKLEQMFPELAPGNESPTQAAESIEQAIPQAEPLEAYYHIELAKHCGVCEDDDRFYGMPVVRELNVEFPVQGANKSEIVSIKLRNGESRPALWKPVSGEDKALVEAVGGILAYREEAAYQVDRVMDLYLVPVAFVAEVDGELGAVLHYVRGRENALEVEYYANEWIEKAAVFDYITGQFDRTGHNWLTHPEQPQRPILIDNGLAFPVKPQKVRSAFVDVMKGKPLSTRVVNAMLVLQKNYGAWRDIEACVGKEAMQQTKERLERLLANSIIPIEEQV